MSGIVPDQSPEARREYVPEDVFPPGRVVIPTVGPGEANRLVYSGGIKVNEDFMAHPLAHQRIDVALPERILGADGVYPKDVWRNIFEKNEDLLQAGTAFLSGVAYENLSRWRIGLEKTKLVPVILYEDGTYVLHLQIDAALDGDAILERVEYQMCYLLHSDRPLPGGHSSANSRKHRSQRRSNPKPGRASPGR